MDSKWSEALRCPGCCVTLSPAQRPQRLLIPMQVRHSRASLHSDGDGLDQLPHDVFLSPYAKVSLACFGHDFANMSCLLESHGLDVKGSGAFTE